MTTKNPQIHEIARNMNHKDYLKLLDYISNVIKVNKKEFDKEQKEFNDNLRKDCPYWDNCKERIRKQARAEIKQFIESERDNGNMVSSPNGTTGFSAGLCLSKLLKKLDEDKTDNKELFPYGTSMEDVKILNKNKKTKNGL